MHTAWQSIILHILSEVCGVDTFPHTCSPLSSVELDLLGSLSSGPTPCEHGWCSLCASCSLPASALYHTASHSLQQSLLTPQRGLPLCLCQPIKGHLGQDKLAYISQNYYTHDNKVMIIIVSQWLGRRWIVFGAVKFFGLQRFKHHPVHDNMAVLAWCGPVTDALEGQAIPALMLNRELRTAGFSPRVTAASEVAGQLCPSWEGDGDRFCWCFLKVHWTLQQRLRAEAHKRETVAREGALAQLHFTELQKSGKRREERRAGRAPGCLKTNKIQPQPHGGTAKPHFPPLDTICAGRCGGREGQYTFSFIISKIQWHKAQSSHFILN